jgi:hypothetical protein
MSDETKTGKNPHDEHQHHQMDTNGFTGHAALHEYAEKRFHRTALTYCQHLLSGDHDSCGDNCIHETALLDTYHLLATT